MKKKILCLALAAAMTIGAPAAVYAEEFTGGDNWTVEFDGENMNSNFTSEEMADVVYDILPGDTMRMQVAVSNGSDGDTDWYMSNEILKSLEEGSTAEGGAYTYILSYTDPSGEVTELYSSDTVGGEGSTEAGEGLQQADDALSDFFYLGRLDAGASGQVSLAVALEGETQGNDYQNTLARLQMIFAVEEAAPDTVTVKEPDKVIHRDETSHQVSTAPKTGDYFQAYLFSGLALAGGVVLVILVAVMMKRRREEEKGERES
jgi:hypothetical protein